MTARTQPLNLPNLSLIEGLFYVDDHKQSIPFYSDELLFAERGIRIAFTTRKGGVSAAPYHELNLATHVGDDKASVEINRKRILDALLSTQNVSEQSAVGEINHGSGLSSLEKANQDMPLLVPNQVHGDHLVVVTDNSQLLCYEEEASKGCDGIVVETTDVAALLNFADCMPVIIVGPDNGFSVVHAGWRGVHNCIAVKALTTLAQYAENHNATTPADYISQCNVYIGPYIHSCCFEVGNEVADKFAEAFTSSQIVTIEGEKPHVDLGAAMLEQLLEVGVDPARIANVDQCTQCNHEQFFSYRADNGQTGRHSALAFRVQ